LAKLAFATNYEVWFKSIIVELLLMLIIPWRLSENKNKIKIQVSSQVINKTKKLELQNGHGRTTFGTKSSSSPKWPWLSYF
jgi:hypothetical protein